MGDIEGKIDLEDRSAPLIIDADFTFGSLTYGLHTEKTPGGPLTAQLQIGWKEPFVVTLPQNTYVSGKFGLSGISASKKAGQQGWDIHSDTICELSIDFRAHPAEACAGLIREGHGDSDWSYVNSSKQKEAPCPINGCIPSSV